MSRSTRFLTACALTLAAGGVLAATAVPAQAAQLRPGSAEDCVGVLAVNGYSAANGYDQGTLDNACQVAVETGDFGPFADALGLLNVDPVTVHKAFDASQWW